MTSIQVAVRVRPLKAGEVPTNNMEVMAESRRVLFGPKVFDCDLLLDKETTQQQMYDAACKNIIDTVMDGQRGSILVYGQTGTGKTHTMFGPTDTPDGVVFSSIKNLLANVKSKEMSLSLSVLEVYMERVTDLFSLKEVPVFCGQPRNVVWKPISNVSEASQMIFTALESRHTASTAMNDRSSRSHVIVNVKVMRASTSDLDEDGVPKIEASNLLLVDLAGSECLGKSRAVGKTAQEASSINRSLLALKQIILALSSTTGQNSHIPYRDSKLTELLQDSIGGCSRTLMIACISPSSRDLEETKSTLEYATKARQIKNLASTDRERMQIKIKSLEFELQKARNKLEQQTQERGVVVVTKVEYEELQQANQKLEEMRVELQRQYEEKDKAENYRHYHAGLQKQLREEIAEMQIKIDEAIEERDFTTKNVQSSLERMRSDLFSALKTYTQNISTQISGVVTSIETTHVSAQSLEDFMRIVQNMSKYVKTSVTEIVTSTSDSIAKNITQMQEISRSDDVEIKKNKEIAAMLSRLNELFEERSSATLVRSTHVKELTSEMTSMNEYLVKRPVDFVSVDALRTTFIKETEKYRDEIVSQSNALHEVASSSFEEDKSFDELLSRGIRSAVTATMPSMKRERETVTTTGTSLPAEIASISSSGQPLSARSTASSGINSSVMAKKRKKTVFSNATNITN